jgi:ubiquinone/menaquinone biosynthesis C-methylase UbiE
MNAVLWISLGVAVGAVFMALAASLGFVFCFSYLFPGDEDGECSLYNRLCITWTFWRLMTGLLGSDGSYRGVLALYDTWGQHLFTDRTRFMNYGYWRGSETLDEACTALADKLGLAGRFGPDDVVLDVGFGFGDQDIFWAEHYRVRRIVGVNISPQQVATARQRIQARDSDRVIFLTIGSATQLPFGDERFDKVVALECAFHFVTRDDFFREAFRVLKPGGCLVTSDILAPLDCRLRDRLLMYYGHSQWQTPIANLYDRLEYQRRLAATGFESASIESIQDFVWGPFARYMKNRMVSPDVRHRIHPIHRNRWSRVLYASSTCWLWPLLKMDYVVAVAHKPQPRG